MATHVVSIVVNWNRRDLLLECLESLTAMAVPDGVAHQILVVDNGSSDGSVEAVSSTSPDVEVIPLLDNVGFARGVNEGLRRALAVGADWTLLVNNDATVESELLAQLLSAGRAADAGEVPGRKGPIGLLAPTILRRATGSVWPSAGNRRWLTLSGRDTTAAPPRRSAYDIDWANGCVVLVSRSLWQVVGLFDERFHFYYEDHDLCLRARAAGFRLLHVPAARAVHRVAASTGDGSPRQRYLLARGSVAYFARHAQGLQRLFIIPYRIGSSIRVVLTCLAARNLIGATSHLRGIRDGLADLRRDGAVRQTTQRRSEQLP